MHNGIATPENIAGCSSDSSKISYKVMSAHPCQTGPGPSNSGWGMREMSPDDGLRLPGRMTLCPISSILPVEPPGWTPKNGTDNLSLHSVNWFVSFNGDLRAHCSVFSLFLLSPVRPNSFLRLQTLLCCWGNNLLSGICSTTFWNLFLRTYSLQTHFTLNKFFYRNQSCYQNKTDSPRWKKR